VLEPPKPPPGYATDSSVQKTEEMHVLYTQATSSLHLYLTAFFRVYMHVFVLQVHSCSDWEQHTILKPAILTTFYFVLMYTCNTEAHNAYSVHLHIILSHSAFQNHLQYVASHLTTSCSGTQHQYWPYV